MSSVLDHILTNFGQSLIYQYGCYKDNMTNFCLFSHYYERSFQYTKQPFILKLNDWVYLMKVQGAIQSSTNKIFNNFMAHKTKLTVIAKVERIVANDQLSGVRVNFPTNKRLIVDDVKTLSVYTNNLPIFEFKLLWYMNEKFFHENRIKLWNMELNCLH